MQKTAMLRLLGVVMIGLWWATCSVTGQETVAIPGQGNLKVFMLSPKATSTNAPPLCVVLPAGDGSVRMAQEALDQLGKPFAERGWFVAVPVSPDNKSFYGANSVKVRALARTLIQRQDIADQRMVLAGISNGGIASFQIASEEPNMVACVVAVPGTVWPSVNLRALMGKPIYYRVGAADQLGWAKNFQSHADNLRRAGAAVDAKLIPNAGHVFAVDWKELNPWLQKTMGKWHPQPQAAR